MLHPSYKTTYFREAKWPQDWVDTAITLVKDTLCRDYSDRVTLPLDSNGPKANLGRVRLSISPRFEPSLTLLIIRRLRTILPKSRIATLTTTMSAPLPSPSPTSSLRNSSGISLPPPSIREIQSSGGLRVQTSSPTCGLWVATICPSLVRGLSYLRLCMLTNAAFLC